MLTLQSFTIKSKSPLTFSSPCLNSCLHSSPSEFQLSLEDELNCASCMKPSLMSLQMSHLCSHRVACIPLLNSYYRTGQYIVCGSTFPTGLQKPQWQVEFIFVLLAYTISLFFFLLFFIEHLPCTGFWVLGHRLDYDNKDLALMEFTS